MLFMLEETHVGLYVKNAIVLVLDGWNDWFTYNTMYTVFYFGSTGIEKRIGSVKIGEVGISQGRPVLPQKFEQLEDKFFSLGQSDEYYLQLTSLGGDVRDEILRALNDIAYDNSLYWRYRGEAVMYNSLMRDISQTSVLGQFHRLANGMLRLSRYDFSYELKSKYEEGDDITLHFEVHPESKPPSNVHVVIGRNGVGKTYLLTSMVKSILTNDGSFYEKCGDGKNKDAQRIFAGLIFVSFSAFDYDIPIENPNKDEVFSIKYDYIGLKRLNEEHDNLVNKKVEDLTEEFVETLKTCLVNSKMNLWKKIVSVLNSDPIFKENSISELLLEINSQAIRKKDEANNLFQKAKDIFNNLSSGHKIVLLTLSSLIARVEERTLVLMDEPEVHLHPPLLAAFTRAVSELLINRNGVAIVATHSPVILQEVPRECVWKLRRYGISVLAERLQIESFGENLGMLTSEVFRHEVTESGVYKMLKENVDEFDSFEEIMEEFQEHLGYEAQAFLRVLLAQKRLEKTDE